MSVALRLVGLALTLLSHLSEKPALAADRKDRCPRDVHAVPTTRPGCACQLGESPETGACPAGYQCATPWVSPGSPDEDPAVGPPVCVPCVYGQFCPRGSYLPPPTGLEQTKRDYVEKYLCEPGFFCPVPDRKVPCPAGAFCPRASVAMTTCNYQELLDRRPKTIIPAGPVTVLAQVYDQGTPIGGNICPPMSTSPSDACAKGHYCPNSSSIQDCPEGFFCKWYSTLPKRCPWLATCPPGSGSADLSLGGFLGLMLILLTLWLAYVALSAYIRLQQDRLVLRQAAKDKLQQLVAPLLCLHDPQALAFKAFGTIRPRISLRFEECGLRLRDGRTILSSVTGYFGHSKVSAVMGPSGSGKSTLLAVLMGTATYGTFTGQVWINGRLMKVSRLRRIMGYVPQDDILHEDLTVREILGYSAWLRSTVHMVSEAKGEVVDDVIDLLRLRHVQHSLVGSVEKRGISGGQRKRVNIGLELVAKPSLLFMDEPTSGLDATAATDILAALRKMADLGMNIVMVVHQPRYGVFTLFHEVLFLGKQGKTVFLGPATAALPYFISLGFELPPNENPADFCLDIISGAVTCRGRPDFQPEDLDSIWETEAANWAGASNMDTELERRSSQPAELSPEQLRLVSAEFDKVAQSGGIPAETEAPGGTLPVALAHPLEQLPSRVATSPFAVPSPKPRPSLSDAEQGSPDTATGIADPCRIEIELAGVDRDGTGLLTPEAITRFLGDLGLEPTSHDVQLVMEELDPRRTGSVTRDDFMQFIRNGGRRHLPPVPDPLDRRLSIELDADKVEAAEPGRAPGPTAGDGAASFQSPPAAAVMTRGPRRAEAEREEHSAPGKLAGSSPKRVWHSILQSSIGNGSQHQQDEDRERGMSPAVSQQWDYETMSTLSQPVVLDEPLEEAQKPSCCQLLGARFKAAGKGCWRCLRRFSWRKRSRYRRIPGNWAQFKLLFRRAGVKWVRGWGYKFIDLLLFVTAALVIGAVHGTAWELERVRGNVTLAMLTLAIISVVASLGVFGKDRLVFWRESSSGLRTSAYFLGHAGLNLIDITVQPAIFMSLYYTLTLPEINFLNYYVVAWMVAWYASGLGYWASVAMAPQNSMVAAATCIMILGGFLNGVDPRFRSLSPFMKHVIGLSYGRWAVEAVTIQEFRQYAHYLQPRAKHIMMEVGYCGLDRLPFGGDTRPSNSLDIMTYCKGYVAWDLMSLLIQGSVLRALTYIWLRFYSTKTRGNPIYRMFTAMWTRCLQHSRRRWLSMSAGSGFLPATIVAGAVSEDATAGSVTDPLLQAERESHTRAAHQGTQGGAALGRA